MVPKSIIFYEKDLGGSMRIVEMLYKTNLFVMVGGDPIPKYPQNKVYFWDDYQGKFTAELTFKKDVKSVKLTQNKYQWESLKTKH